MAGESGGSAIWWGLGTEQCVEVEEILFASCRSFVRNEVLLGNKVYRLISISRFDASGPGILKRHTINRRDNVDAKNSSKSLATSISRSRLEFSELASKNFHRAHSFFL